MRNSLLLFTFVLISVILIPESPAQPPEAVWTQDYGLNNEQEWVHSMIAEPGGGFVLSGFRPIGMFIARADADGNSLWATTLSGDHGYGIARTANGGYLICGSDYFQNWGTDIIVHWVNSDGEHLRTAQAGAEEYERAMAIVTTPDDGCLVAAYREYDINQLRTVLFKMDGTGNVEWQRQYGTNDNFVRDLLACSDGNYLVAGARNPNNFPSEMYLLKVDPDGEILWARVYGTGLHQEATKVIEVAEGGYLVIGYGNTWDDELSNQIIVKRITETGDVIWTRSLGDDYSDTAFGVVQTPDGGFAISGSRVPPTGGSDIDAMVYKLDADGNLEWVHRSYRPRKDWGISVVLTNEGTLAFGGTVNPDPNFNQDGYITLLSPEPDPSELTLTPINPPLIVPAEGGEISFDVLMTNPSEIPVDLDFWFEVELPNGLPYGPQLITSTTLPPFAGLNELLTQEVPSFAPPGVYTFNGLIGIMPYIVYSRDSFEFTKSAEVTGASPIRDWLLTRGEQVDESNSALRPKNYELREPYPNPFNALTTVTVALPESSNLTVTVFNTLGQQVAELVNGRVNAGTQSLTFDASDLSSGIYFIQATVPGKLDSMQKIVLVK
jgi:Secretion system C-terminal sorting domain